MIPISRICQVTNVYYEEAGIHNYSLLIFRHQTCNTCIFVTWDNLYHYEVFRAKSQRAQMASQAGDPVSHTGLNAWKGCVFGLMLCHLLLKFSLVFEEGALHFCFAQDLTNELSDPASGTNGWVGSCEGGGVWGRGRLRGTSSCLPLQEGELSCT